MDLRHLLTFQAVLREGSFGRAARALDLAQPTVTLHIQELETELGLKLFDRRGRQRLQTEAGRLLTARGLPILEALDSLSRSMEELRDGRGGLLRIGSIEPTASRRVTPLLAGLRRQRPGLRVRLETGGTAGVSRGVADRQLDFGLCSAPPVELGLCFEPFFAEEMALVLPRSHPLARARSVSAGELRDEPLLLTEQGCAYRQAIESGLQARGVRPDWALESGSTESLLSAVRHRLGLALLPRPAVTPAPPGTAVRRLRDLVIALPIGLVTRPDAAAPTPALAALVDALRAQLAQKPVERRAGPARMGARR